MQKILDQVGDDEKRRPRWFGKLTNLIRGDIKNYPAMLLKKSMNR